MTMGDPMLFPELADPTLARRTHTHNCSIRRVMRKKCFTRDSIDNCNKRERKESFSSSTNTTHTDVFGRRLPDYACPAPLAMADRSGKQITCSGRAPRGAHISAEQGFEREKRVSEYEEGPRQASALAPVNSDSFNTKVTILNRLLYLIV